MMIYLDENSPSLKQLGFARKPSAYFLGYLVDYSSASLLCVTQLCC